MLIFLCYVFSLVSFAIRLKVPREISHTTANHSNLENPMVKIIIVPIFRMNKYFHANIKLNHIIYISAVSWN